MAVKALPFDVPDRELIHCIYKNWLALLGSIAANDAVATSLIAWGKNTGETRLLQLGDGAVLYQANDGRGLLSGRSENTFGNETTGLGVSRKYSDWVCRTIWLTKPKQGLALMTDGISDDLEQMDTFVPEVIMKMRHMGRRYGKQWITNELESWPTPSHSDDKTIALIYRM